MKCAGCIPSCSMSQDCHEYVLKYCRIIIKTKHVLLIELGQSAQSIIPQQASQAYIHQRHCKPL